MSDYDFRPGGSLKLKGGVVDGGIVKKYVPFSPAETRQFTLLQEEEEVKGQGQGQRDCKGCRGRANPRVRGPHARGGGDSGFAVREQ